MTGPSVIAWRVVELGMLRWCSVEMGMSRYEPQAKEA